MPARSVSPACGALLLGVSRGSAERTQARSRPHSAAAVELALAEAAADLGLSADQVRRGVQALVATGCWRAEAQPGRASRYAMAADVLWAPEPLETAALSTQAPIHGAVQPPTAPAAPSAPPAEPVSVELPQSPEPPRGDSTGGWKLIVPRGVRFTLPPEARDTRVSLDPAGNLIIVIERARAAASTHRPTRARTERLKREARARGSPSTAGLPHPAFCAGASSGAAPNNLEAHRSPPSPIAARTKYGSRSSR